eukprot:m51a1_g4810 putative serine threonine protein (329) ;mRNA; f:132561-134532
MKEKVSIRAKFKVWRAALMEKISVWGPEATRLYKEGLGMDPKEGSKNYFRRVFPHVEKTDGIHVDRRWKSKAQSKLKAVMYRCRRAAFPAPGTGLAGACAQLKGAGAEAAVFVGDEGSAHASMDPGAEVTAASIFQVGRLSLGPFVQGGGPDKPCNQGLDRVWLTRWANGSFVLDGPSVPQSHCGSEYDPLDAPAGTDAVLIVKFAVPFGIIAVCAAVGIMVVLYKTRTRLEDLNIRRSEVEINNQLGRGRLGAVHVGDWNGTTVAVRVIEKTKATRDDLRSIKREIALLHKLHHPSLLMLMGLCETKTELLVISEYMEGGSLDQYPK